MMMVMFSVMRMRMMSTSLGMFVRPSLFAVLSTRMVIRMVVMTVKASEISHKFLQR